MIYALWPPYAEKCICKHILLGFVASLPPPLVLIWSSDSETQMSQNLGTIIVETSQKISPIEDGGDQKETDQTEDSYAQQREMQTCSHEDGKALKVC